MQYSAALPGHAPSGVYTIAVEVTDELAEKTIRRELPVKVEGDTVRLSDELTIRNFGFAHVEGGTPLPEPAYDAGETIWASFYITGYKTRDDNSYDVASELRVVGPEGETLYSFKPQGESGSPFYPRLWLPATFRLDLDDDIPSGEYAVVLEVTDKVGEATTQISRSFRIR